MWEEIPSVDAGNKDTSIFNHRLKVPGGWIVRTIVSRPQSSASVDQMFVTDTDHEWVLEKVVQGK